MILPFSHLIQVAQEDIDELGHVNNVVYVRYVQEVAAAHWNTVASEPLRQNICGLFSGMKSIISALLF